MRGSRDPSLEQARENGMERDTGERRGGRAGIYRRREKRRGLAIVRLKAPYWTGYGPEASRD